MVKHTSSVMVQDYISDQYQSGLYFSPKVDAQNQMMNVKYYIEVLDTFLLALTYIHKCITFQQVLQS